MFSSSPRAVAEWMGRDAEKVDVEVLVEDELEEEVVVLVEEMRPEEVALVSLSVKVLFIPSAGTFDPHIFMEHLNWDVI